MSTEEDWLNEDVPLASGPPALPAIVNDEQKFGQLTAALRKCSPKQRAFLLALQEHAFDEKAAIKALAKKGTRVSWHRVKRWRELEPWFNEAQQHATDYALAALGVSHVGVLSQLMRAVRVNGATVKCKTDQGVEYERFVDATNMLHALDRLGKRVKMFNTDEEAASNRRQLPAFVVGVQVQTGNNPDNHTTVKVISDG